METIYSAIKLIALAIPTESGILKLLILNDVMSQENIWDGLYEDNLTWKKETITLPKSLKGKVVLELGVGNGKTLISILKQKPKKVYAIDFSAKAIEKSREIFGDAATFIKANARKIPLPDNSVDAVLAYYVLNNSLEKDRKKIISEIYRVLTKKGICIFEDFSIGDFRNDGLRHKVDKNTKVKKSKLICHFFDEQEIRNLFDNFSAIKTKRFGFSPIRKKSEIKREILNVVAKK